MEMGFCQKSNAIYPVAAKYSRDSRRAAVPRGRFVDGIFVCDMALQFFLIREVLIREHWGRWLTPNS